MRLLAGLLLVAALALMTPPPQTATGADPLPAGIHTEIEHLFTYLESSGCDFYRNGSWYDAEEAAAHLRRKFRHLFDQGRITTAESFIDLGASESSVSGEPYRVRCGDTGEVASRTWFRAELARFRQRGSRTP